MAGVEGLEPPTSGFGDRRSSQLSYTPTGTGLLHQDRTRGRVERMRRAESQGMTRASCTGRAPPAIVLRRGRVECRRFGNVRRSPVRVATMSVTGRCGARNATVRWYLGRRAPNPDSRSRSAGWAAARVPRLRPDPAAAGAATRRGRALLAVLGRAAAPTRGPSRPLVGAGHHRVGAVRVGARPAVHECRHRGSRPHHLAADRAHGTRAARRVGTRPRGPGHDCACAAGPAGRAGLCAARLAAVRSTPISSCRVSMGGMARPMVDGRGVPAWRVRRLYETGGHRACRGRRRGVRARRADGGDGGSGKRAGP